MKFDDLIGIVTSAKFFTMTIKGKIRKAVFCASYYTERYPDEVYFKVFFDDDTILEIMPSSEELYFCDDARREVDKNLITDFGEYLKIDGKEYLLYNYNDKQFVKKVYFGNLEDGEGECVFSDYGFADEIWSLAVLDNDKESDVHVKIIDVKDVKVK